MEMFERKEQPSPLQAFQERIAARKEEDIARGGPAHLFDVEPSELGDADREIYEKIEAGTITRDEFKAYDKTIGGGVAKSRKEFRAFIANKCMSIFLEQEYEKMKTEQ